MKMSTCNNVLMTTGTFLLLLMTVVAAPAVDSDEEQSENALGGGEDGEYSAPWDPATAAALRKLLLQIDEDRFSRASRAWPQTEPRGWGLRAMDGRLVRQWRADKRQVRFRQCYFNPISCFRK